MGIMYKRNWAKCGSTVLVGNTGRKFMESLMQLGHGNIFVLGTLSADSGAKKWTGGKAARTYEAACYMGVTENSGQFRKAVGL